MASSNPFEQPLADLTPPIASQTDDVLDATLGQRLVGAIIDGLISTCVALGLGFGISALGLDFAPRRTELPNLSWMPSGILLACCTLPVTAVQVWLLKNRSQTIGKIAAKTRIVDVGGGPAGLEQSFVLRMLPLMIIHWVVLVLQTWPAAPIVSMAATAISHVPTVDTLFIFHHSRRCLHDRIARTRVVVISQNMS